MNAVRWIAAIAAVMFAACDYSIPLPAEVVIVDERVDEREFQIWTAVGEEWNDAAPGVVEGVTRGRRSAGCGRIYVSRRAPGKCFDKGQYSDANTHMDGLGCNAEVTMCADESDTKYHATGLHELAHIFTASGHHWDTGDGISEELAAIVRRRMGGAE